MSNQGIFITGKDIAILHGLSNVNNAYKKIALLKDCLGKKRHQKITYQEYADYYGIDVSEILKALKL